MQNKMQNMHPTRKHHDHALMVGKKYKKQQNPMKGPLKRITMPKQC
jgi:hypothetical protein